MNYEEFKKLVLSRQACRTFNDESLDGDTVDKIVNLSLMCPSARNMQPWKLYVAKSENKLKEVATALQDGGRNAFLSKAKAFIVVSEVETEIEGVKSKFTECDVGEMTAYLTLTAKSLGVESCIIGWINLPKLKQAVGMGDNENCRQVIALGYSDIPLREKVRKDKSETVVKL